MLALLRGGQSLQLDSLQPAKRLEEATSPLSLLLIDDDRDLCAMMREFFEESGHRLHYEHDGRRGLIAALSRTYDLVILDVMLPSIDGFTVLEHIRNRHDMPVVMLTARAQHRDRIQGLNTGADDYLLKPFDPDELLARIHAVLRRTGGHRRPEAVRVIEDCTIDFAAREVRVAGEPVVLTDMEFDLLEVLVRRSGRTVPRDELAVILFERASAPHDRILDVHVSNLRKKLGRARKLLRTVRGVGYVFARSV